MTRCHTLAIASTALLLLAPARGQNAASGAERKPDSAAGKTASPFERGERPKGPTEITARDAMFDNRIHVATFTGDVLVTDPEFGLSCASLSVYLKKPAAKDAAPPPAAAPKLVVPDEPGSGIEKAVAEGDVVITQDKSDADGKAQRYMGRAERAVFDNTTGTLTLSGWPQISQSLGGSVSKQITAREKTCVIILNRIGKIEVKGYHSSTILDAETLGKNQRQP